MQYQALRGALREIRRGEGKLEEGMIANAPREEIKATEEVRLEQAPRKIAPEAYMI